MKIVGTAIGLVMLILGIVLAIIGISSFTSQFESPNPDAGLGAMGMMAVGFILLTIGLFLVYISNIGRMASYFAKEMSPAMQTASTAFGRGMRSGGFVVNTGQNPAAPRETVKIRCRHCGYLETEDAKFCSNCGDVP